MAAGRRGKDIAHRHCHCHKHHDWTSFGLCDWVITAMCMRQVQSQMMQATLTGSINMKPVSEEHWLFFWCNGNGGAAILFQWSVQLHGFRYSEMLGDRNAKTNARLLQEDPYDGRPIEKLVCVSHVTKRLGTALKNLVEKKKAQGGISGGGGGGGRGKLTEIRTKELTNYYGRAIRDNSGNLEAMKTAVWASFFHTISCDESHCHDCCPKGSSSWCFHQQAIADNVPPCPHGRPLPSGVDQALKPIYERRGDPQLLRRCLAGKAQNSNESFRSLLGSISPKERWSNLCTVDTALAIAIRFDKGASALMNVLLELELVAGPSLEEYSMKEDTSRVAKATRSTSAKQRERRKRVETARQAEQQQRHERGEVYGPGQFWGVQLQFSWRIYT